MRVASSLGFGWPTILTLVVAGVGINLLHGPAVWALYPPFIAAGVYMSVRFRQFNTQPWRRTHSRIMQTYRRCAAREYDVAREEGREFDIGRSCRALADALGEAEAPSLLSDDGRKAHYRSLVVDCPQVFLQGIAPEKHAAALDAVRRDIDKSTLGPDIVIAKAIERERGRAEAARYLQALLLGKVRS